MPVRAVAFQSTEWKSSRKFNGLIPANSDPKPRRTGSDPRPDKMSSPVRLLSPVVAGRTVIGSFSSRWKACEKRYGFLSSTIDDNQQLMDASLVM